jgi:hypothetical protein
LLIFLAALVSRNLAADTKVNVIIGAFTVVTGVLSTLLAWSMWRLARAGRRRRGHESKSSKRKCNFGERTVNNHQVHRLIPEQLNYFLLRDSSLDMKLH